MSASQITLHRRWLEQRQQTIDALESSEEKRHHARARRLDGCCFSPSMHMRPDGTPALRLHCCRDRLCPRCQVSRGVSIALRIQTQIASFNAVRFATLTLKHEERPLGESIDALHAAFRRLRKQDRWKQKVERGIYVLQVTRNPATATWHPHLHLIIDGDFYDQRALSKDWEKASGTSCIVDIRAVHDKQRCARYVADYVSKPNNVKKWTTGAIREFSDAMSGRRLVHRFGDKRRSTFVDSSTCEPLTEAIKQSPVVADASSLLSWIRKGDVAAEIATERLASQSVTWWRALGGEPPPIEVPKPSFTQDEIKEAFAYAMECFRRPVHWTMADLEHSRVAMVSPQPTVGLFRDQTR